MERVIKFRGMKSDNSMQWVYGSLCNPSDVHNDAIIMEWDSNSGIARTIDYNVMQDSVGQFTGFKDKNGVEIYEGDIVYVDYNYLGSNEVKFINGGFNIASYNLDKCKVVGNIHEPQVN